MPARVLTLVNQKGGCGKSTLSMQLAGTMAKDYSVLVVDADSQGTATRWASAAPDETPFPATLAGLSAAGEKLHREVAKYIHTFDVIVIDCPPAVDSIIPQSALLIADLALVPIIPSPPDLWAGMAIRHLIESLSMTNSSLIARLVINQLQPRTRLSQKVVEILPEFEIPLVETQIHQRTAYRESAAYGCTVHQMGNKAAAAAQEITSLSTELIALLQPTT